MFRMEFHGAEGGRDAEAFCTELAHGVAKYAQMTIRRAGRVVIAEPAVRL